MVLNFDLLPSHLEKMKCRNLSFLSADNRSCMVDTNKLLIDGLVLDLIRATQENCESYYSAYKSDEVDSVGVRVFDERMSLCSEVLFFVCYQTQLVNEEEKKIMELLQFLSNLLTLSSNIYDEKFGAISDAYCEWHLPLLNVFITVQMGHICSLQQKTYLLNRDVDFTQVFSLDQLVYGNSLQVDDFCVLHRKDLQFHCLGVVGVSFLCYSFMKTDETEASFMVNAACQCGVFSYLRLVVLPAVQANASVKKELNNFFIEILSDLMEGIANFIGSWSTSSILNYCVPPNRDFFMEHFSDYSCVACSCCNRNIAGQSCLLKSFCIDAMDDLVCLFVALLNISPRFCAVMCAHLDKNTRDSFVVKVCKLVPDYPNMLLHSIEFLSGLACLAKANTAQSVFNFVESSDIPLLNWNHFLSVIDLVSFHLNNFVPEVNSPEMSYPLANSNYSLFSTVGGGGTVRVVPSGATSVKVNTDIKSPYVMTSEDTEGLVAICRFIESISVNEDVSFKMFQKYGVVSRLFRLLLCSVPLCVKGSVLSALSVLGGINSVISVEIWGQLEYYKFFIKDGCGLYDGLREDVSVESGIGKYYLTDGLLKLIQRLLFHGVPDSLGAGYRSPGISHCLWFCIDEILLRTVDWRYCPSQWPAAEGQRWRLISRAVLILVEIVQHYMINLVTPEMIQSYYSASNHLNSQLDNLVVDFVLRTPSVKDTRSEKSVGYVVMCNLLSRSALFDFLITTLRDCSVGDVRKAFDDHYSFELGSSIDLLHKLHHLSSGSNLTFHLSDLGREDTVCDPVYWRERCSSSILGLLYEVSLRETTFRNLITLSTCPGPEDPIVTDDLSVLLASSSCIPILVNFLRSSGLTSPSAVGSHLMTIRLLQQILLRYPTIAVLSNLVNVKRLDSLGLVSVLERSRDLVVRGVFDNSQNNDFLASHILHYEMIPLGGDCLLDYFTPSMAHTFQSPPNIMRYYGCSQESCISDLCSKIIVHGNIRCAAINLLLSTLQPCCSPAHCVLLGFGESMPNENFDYLQRSSDLKNLELLLDIMSPAHYSHRSSFVQLSRDAADCYELLYRLSCSKESSDLILTRLRQNSMKFYEDHFFSLIEVLYGNGSVVQNAVFLCLSWLLRLSMNQVLHHRELCRFDGLRVCTMVRRLFDCDISDDLNSFGQLLTLWALRSSDHDLECTFPSDLYKNCMSDMLIGKAGNGFGVGKNSFIKSDAKISQQLQQYVFIDLRALNILIDNQSLSKHTIEGLYDRALSFNKSTEDKFCLEYFEVVFGEFLCIVLEDDALRSSFTELTDADYCNFVSDKIIKPLVAILRSKFCKHLCKVLFASVAHLLRFSRNCGSSFILRDVSNEVIDLYLSTTKDGKFTSEFRSVLSSVVALLLQEEAACSSVKVNPRLLSVIETLCNDIDGTSGDENCVFVTSLIGVADYCSCLKLDESNGVLKLFSQSFVCKLVQFNSGIGDLFNLKLNIMNDASVFSVFLNIFVHLGATSNGVQALLQANIFSALNSFSYFNSLPIDEGEKIVFCQHLNIVFRLFSVMFHNGLDLTKIAAGIVGFVLGNRNIFSPKQLMEMLGIEFVDIYSSLLCDVFWKLKSVVDTRTLLFLNKDCKFIFQGLCDVLVFVGGDLVANLKGLNEGGLNKRFHLLDVAISTACSSRLFFEYIRNQVLMNIEDSSVGTYVLVVFNSFCVWFVEIVHFSFSIGFAVSQESSGLLSLAESLLCIIYEMVEGSYDDCALSQFPRISEKCNLTMSAVLLRRNHDVLKFVSNACESHSSSLIRQLGLSLRLLANQTQ